MAKIDPTDRKALLQQALSALEEMRAKLAASERRRTEPIAIVGMACRYPGGVADPDGLWRLLDRGEDAIGEWPADRPMAGGTEAPAPRGGFLSEIDRFEPEFFSISPREAATLDPQQRLLLETAWEALERAGHAPDGLAGTETGVFIGITTSDYSRLVGIGSAGQSDVYAATGNALNAAAGRLSFVLGLQGPSVAVDTACSSSLVAIHLACQSLRAGESRLALAGGVNIVLNPDAAALFAKWGMLAPDARCKTFDAAADGFVRSEGCGMLVLARLSDALAEGRPVLAVIRGSASNHDGRSSGLTVPNGPAQQAVIRRALANAGIKPSAVQYVEAHGTGTPIGDPIEVEALAAEYGRGRDTGDPLLVGSIKTNIGHAEAASGVAGVIKTVLALQHERIPRHLHFRVPNPRLDWTRLPVRVAAEPTPWPRGDRPRIAGVSAFGFSGTNAHLLLEEAPLPSATAAATAAEIATAEAASVTADRPRHLLVLSARSDEALRQTAGRVADHLEAHPEQAVADVCFTAATGRAHFAHRLALPAATSAELVAALRRRIDGRGVDARAAGDRSAPAALKVGWLFTGQGAQHAGMSRAIYAAHPGFRDALDACDAILRPHLDRSLTAVLFADAGDSPIHDTRWTQPALFAVEYALATLWQEWGLRPAVVLGHSLGEYVAATVAGVLSLEDALMLVATRGRLMQALPPDGGMAAVAASEADVTEAIHPYRDRLAIAAVNGARDVVVSGERAALEQVTSAFARRGVTSVPLIVSHAFHSPLMAPMIDELDRALQRVACHPARVPMVANVTGAYLPPGTTLDAAYWRRHTLAPVRFAESIDAARAAGVSTWLEIGPAPTLSSLVKRIDPHSRVVPSLRAGKDDWATLLAAVGDLYVAGAPIDWRAFDRRYARRLVALPTYPFQRRSHWVEAARTSADRSVAARAAAPGAGAAHPLLGARLDLSGGDGQVRWQHDLDLSSVAYLLDHRVQGVPVLPATAYAEMAIAAVSDAAGDGPITLSAIRYHRPMVLDEQVTRCVQSVLRPEDDGWTFDVFSRDTDGAAWVHHMTARAHRLSESPSSADAFTRLDELRARSEQRVSKAQFYARLGERGNTWGPAFQGLHVVDRRDGEAVSEVRVPDDVRPDVSRYFCHPAVSDACGHVLTATIPLARSTSARGGAFVGGAIDEIRFYRKSRGDRFYAHARLRDEAGAEANVLVGDVWMYDSTGALVSQTIGARLFYFDGAAAACAGGTSNVADWLYDVAWHAAPPGAVDPRRRREEPGPWIVLCDRQGVGDALAEALRGAGELVSCVPATSIADGASIDAALALARERGETPRGIVHLWSLDQPEAEEGDVAPLEATGTRPCLTATHIVRALAASGMQAPVWLVTRGAQRVDEDDRPAINQAALWGWGRALAEERRPLWGGLVDLDAAAPARVSAEGLCRELLAPDAEDQVALRGDRRLGLRLVRAVAPAGVPAARRWRADSTYLITGGFGGLGLEVARWMVAHGARRLILMGRSALPDRAVWHTVDPDSPAGRRIAAVRKLEGLGASVHIAAVDVADARQVRAFALRFQQEGWPPIRGVVHAAGVVHHGPIETETADSLAEVLAPKLAGGWVLHSVFGDALEAFVLFSSASSVLSSPLIAAYAAANASLDALAQHRRARGLSATVVNWGLWSQVGMGAELTTGAGRATGLLANTLSPEQGLAALDLIVARDATQVVVVPTDWRTWAAQHPAAAASPVLAEVVSGEKVVSARPERSWAQVHEAAGGDREVALPEYVISQIEAVIGVRREDVDLDLPMTAMGLDSLMALELRNRFEADLRVDVPVVRFLEGPTVRELIAAVTTMCPPSPARTASAVETAPPRSASPSVASGEAGHALSVLQQSLFFFEQLEPGTAVYVNPLTLHIRGPFDPGLCERALAAIVERHAALRTSFHLRDGVPVQVIHPAARLELELVDRSNDAASLDDALATVAQAVRRPFDLAVAPLIRAGLVRLGPTEHLLWLAAHQIVCDGWSWTVLLGDFSKAYADLAAGRPPAFQPLRIQFTDIIARQRARASTSEAALAFWEDYLRGAPPATEWPLDRARPVARTYAGAQRVGQTSADVMTRLAAVGRNLGATPFMVALAAFKALLFQQTGQQDLVIGSPVAGRGDPDAAGLVGGFINTVAIRTQVDGDLTVADLVRRVRATTLAAFGRQETPFPAVIDRVSPPRDRTRTPLFQIFFNMVNFAMPELPLPGASIAVGPSPPLDAKFDLTFYLRERPTGLHIELVYSSELFEPRTIEQLLSDYLRVLDVVSREPEVLVRDLPLDRAPVETCRSPLASDLAVPPVPDEAIERSIIGRFHDVVAQHGPMTAVVAVDGTSLPYGEIAAWATGVAAALHAAAPSTPLVGLLCENDAPMIAGLFGILQAGFGYVPLDSLAPVARLDDVCRDAELSVIVADSTNHALAARLVGDAHVVDIETSSRGTPPGRAAATTPDAIAYLLYTSGSTGRPKGVVQNQRNVLHFNRVYSNNLRIRPSDRLTLVSSYCFDAAAMDIFGALLNGATLVMTDVRRQGIDALRELVRDRRVTIYHSTPTVFRQVFPDDARPEDYRSLRAVVLGGEEAQGHDFRRFARLCPDAWLVNGLGPTEATVTMQAFFQASDAVERRTLPVGLPVDGMRVSLLDAAGRPHPLHGELAIESPHVALGYWRAPDLTARAFDVAPDGRRRYRTGDLARRLPDGRFEFLGRRDTQVKLRGYRIELGEIEVTLAQDLAVARAAAVCVDAGATQSLVAFVAPHAGLQIDLPALRRRLREALPEYMVPAAIHVLDELPLTPSGKIDRIALAARAQRDGEPRASAAAAPPETDTERGLAEIWREVLNVDLVGRDDDFFALGGNSVQVAQILTRVRERFHAELPLRAMFSESTLAGLAAVIEGAGAPPHAAPREDREEVEL